MLLSVRARFLPSFLVVSFLVLPLSSALEPDLVIQNLSVSPESVMAGGTATVSFAVRNQGSGSVLATTTNVRLSTSTSDPLLYQLGTPSLASGRSTVGGKASE